MMMVINDNHDDGDGDDTVMISTMIDDDFDW